MVIKLTADENGKLAFTLRPTIPYLQDFVRTDGKENGAINEGITKHGNVTASVSNGENIITLKGNMGYYNIDFVAEYRVFTDGEVTTGEWTHIYDTYVGYTEEPTNNPEGYPTVSDEYNSGIRDVKNQTLTVTNGTLNISGANEAYIVITLGTNYDQSKGAENEAIIGGSDIKASGAAIDAFSANEARMTAVLEQSFNKENITLSSS